MSGDNPYLHPEPIRRDGERDALVLSAGSELIRLEGTASAGFQPGWRALFLYSGLAPILVLQLDHEQLGRVVWYVSSSGHRLGDRISDLSESDRAILRHRAAPILGRILAAIVEAPTPQFGPAERGYLALDERCRLELWKLCEQELGLPIRSCPLQAAPDAILAAPGGRAPVVLHKTHLQRVLQLNLQNALPDILRAGNLAVCCPVTGQEVMSQGSLCFDDFHFAYRFTDGTGQLVFYLVAGQELSRIYALYVPCLATAFSLAEVDWAGPTALQVMAWLPGHVARHATQLEGYFSRPLQGATSPLRAPPWTHIGHQLWNELTGLERLLGRLPPEAPLPDIAVPDGSQPVEFYGRIDELFPRLRGHVTRGLRDAEDLVRRSYEQGRLVIRITDSKISAPLRDRIIAHARDHAVSPSALIRLDHAGGPIVLLGVRMENRTHVDLTGLYERLVAFLLARWPQARFIVDGHNASATGHSKFGSHGEHPGQATLVQQAELDLLERLQARYGTDRIVGAVGLTVPQNLLFVERCNVFVSMWGAGLAKYRWACNKPGYVMTSRWNLENRNDLRIYDHDETMEAPAPMRWVPARFVADHPESPRLLSQLVHEQWMNFSVDEDAVFQDIADWLAGSCGAYGREHSNTEPVG